MNTSAPAFIEFILHCYCSREPFERRDSPYHSELIKELYDLEMIEVGDQSDIWVTTEKGQVYATSILRAVGDIPLPYWTCAKLNVQQQKDLK